MIFFVCILLFNVSLSIEYEYVSFISRQDIVPQQIHIAFGENPNEIMITWSTFNKTGETMVKYGESELDQLALGYGYLFEENFLEFQQYTHRTLLKNLKFNTTYFYQVGSSEGWSGQLSFRTPPADENWPLRALVFGDMGLVNARALPYIEKDVATGDFDVILHIGDFAYDMEDDEGRVGNKFMDMIQPVAAKVPYMTCPGNHENYRNISQYKNRFTMPKYSERLFYSWNMGPIHFISIVTEYYMKHFSNANGIHPLLNQYDWLVKDLEEASKPENRKKRPWIILYGHRPMYCSEADDYDCVADSPIRVGFESLGRGIEVLLKKYGVDVALWAHVHYYERLFPVYNKTMYNGSYEEPYNNPNAPVHVISGSAGGIENTDPYFLNPPGWSAVRSSDYGYSRMTVHNVTHLYMEQISVDKGGSIVDSFWLVKNNHGPYNII